MIKRLNDDIHSALAVVERLQSVAPSTETLEIILVKVEEIDNFLDTIRPSIIKLASLPIIKHWAPIKILAEALQHIEEVFDEFPHTAD